MVERRSALRGALVWDAVRPVLLSLGAAESSQSQSAQPIRVVDLGGGTGGLAVRIAELGHAVTVVDPSPDALASLERRAADAEVSDRVRGVLGDAAGLLDVVPPGSADLVVCHGVLEVVDAPDRALDAIARALAPDGALSLVAAQRSGAVLGRAFTGHVEDARALLADADGRWGSADPMPRRFSRDQLTALVSAAGLDVEEVRGVRVFVDHLEGSDSDRVTGSDPGASVDALHQLEAELSRHPDFIPIAAQLHVHATRRQSG